MKEITPRKRYRYDGIYCYEKEGRTWFLLQIFLIHTEKKNENNIMYFWMSMET